MNKKSLDRPLKNECIALQFIVCVHFHQLLPSLLDVHHKEIVGFYTYTAYLYMCIMCKYAYVCPKLRFRVAH